MSFSSAAIFARSTEARDIRACFEAGNCDLATLLDAARGEPIQHMKLCVAESREGTLKALIEAFPPSNSDRMVLARHCLCAAGRNQNHPRDTLRFLDLALPPGSEADVDLFHHAFCFGAPSAYVERILRAGADPNKRMASGQPPLPFCVTMNRADSIPTLIAWGADTSIVVTGAGNLARHAMNIVEFAAFTGHKESLTVLLDLGFRPRQAFASGAHADYTLDPGTLAILASLKAMDDEREALSQSTGEASSKPRPRL